MHKKALGTLSIIGLISFVALAFNALASSPIISQNMVDLNGGIIAVGDQLEYAVTITNNTGQDITNPEFEEIIPIGTEYITNSLVVDGSTVTDALDGDAMHYDSTANALGFNVQTIAAGVSMVMKFKVEVVGSDLYFVNNGDPATAHKLNKETGAILTTHVLTGQTSVYGLALTDEGRYLYGVSSATDRVFKYDLAQEQLTELGSIGLGDVGVPCLDINGGYDLIAADSKKDRLIKVNKTTGSGEELVRLRLDENTKLNIVGGDCAFGADGMLYVMSNTSANKTGDLYLTDPDTGYGYLVNNVSQTQFFTGLALDTTGYLYASSNKDDGLYRLNTNGQEAVFLGPFGVSHGGGDLAMAASQKLKIIATASYTDDNGNEEEVTTTHTTIGDPPVDPIDQGSVTNLVTEVLVDSNGDGVYEDSGQSVNAGDTIDYMIKYGNIGVNLDTIDNLDIDITVPTGVSYMRDSLRAEAYNNFPDNNQNPGTPRTDLVGDDSGNYDQANDKPYFRVKKVESGQNGHIKFKLFVNNNTAASAVGMSATVKADSNSAITLTASNPVSNSGGFNGGATTDYHLVFDSSFSMGYEINGQRKIDIATTALKAAIDSVLTEGVTTVDLRAYGSEYAQSAGQSCQDSKRVVNSAPLNKEQMNGTLDTFIPNGYTPIDLSLRRVKDDIINGSNAANNQQIILISDGEESCGGNVVAAAQNLIQGAAANGINVIIDTIGFNVGTVARSELQNIAEITGGTYFDAA